VSVFIPIISRGIDYIIVLDCVEDLIHQLKETEARVVALREEPLKTQD
jgi:hypothetical protein